MSWWHLDAWVPLGCWILHSWVPMGWWHLDTWVPIGWWLLYIGWWLLGSFSPWGSGFGCPEALMTLPMGTVPWQEVGHSSGQPGVLQPPWRQRPMGS